MVLVPFGDFISFPFYSLSLKVTDEGNILVWYCNEAGKLCAEVVICVFEDSSPVPSAYN